MSALLRPVNSEDLNLMVASIKEFVCNRFSIQNTRNNMEKSAFFFLEELRGV
jgi:hypothetical protein